MGFFSLGLGLLSLFLAASYWGHTLYVAGEYRALPWFHLIGALLLAVAAVILVRASRGKAERWQSKLSKWLGVAVTVVIALMLWLFIFVGSRLPTATAPALATAAAFRLPDDHGEMVELADIRERGPVVLFFFRGGFDMFARAGLLELESRRQRIEDAGASICAISADSRHDLGALRAKLGLGFRLLSDIDLSVARRYRLVPREARTANPAVLLVSRAGLVEWMHFFKSASDLPHPDDIARRVDVLVR